MSEALKYFAEGMDPAEVPDAFERFMEEEHPDLDGFEATLAAFRHFAKEQGLLSEEAPEIPEEEAHPQEVAERVMFRLHQLGAGELAGIAYEEIRSYELGHEMLYTSASMWLATAGDDPEEFFLETGLWEAVE